MPIEHATFGGGCFWCTEAVFSRLKGVQSVVPGYAGGEMEHPSYEQVSGGKTGHAEVVQIAYDPSRISYKDLLSVFFAVHDSTQKDRQGADVGPQYRSVIFPYTQDQEDEAVDAIGTLRGQGISVATEVVPLGMFWIAEEHHWKYYDKNPSAPYCQVVIAPKIEKLTKEFKDMLSSKKV